MRVWERSIAAGVVVLLLASGACSSDDGDGSSAATTTTAPAPDDQPALSYETWYERVSEICSAAHGEVEALQQQAGDDPSVDEMMTVITGTLELGTAQLASIQALGTPVTRGDEVEELTDAMQAQIDLFGPIIATGETGDAEALQAALRAPEVQSTQSHLDEVATGLDLPDCGTGEG